MSKLRHVLDSELSEGEKAQLEAFASNKMMLDTVKKVMLFPIYNSGVMQKGKAVEPRLNFFLNLYTSKPVWDSAELGHEVKVRSEALMLIENAFMEVEGYAPSEENRPHGNPAL